MSTYSLNALNNYIRRVLALNLPEPVWIQAEIWQVNTSRGHTYLELVQKSEDTDEIAAQASAVIWERNLRLLKSRYGKELDNLLRDGIEVRIKARVDFHERYGLKLNIEDIDPAFTLGQLELRRRQTLEALQLEGLLGRNAALPMPALVQHIAVISAETAAGYHDFCDQLLHNTYGYRYKLSLFPAAVQGAAALVEVPRQLRAIARQSYRFDAIVLIRGGGSRTDLAVFDELVVCRAAAESPLPILTGIGHETDESLLDLVAQLALKTPTAVAEWLIARSLHLDMTLGEAALRLQRLAQHRLQYEDQRLIHTQARFQALGRSLVQRRHDALQNAARELPGRARRRLQVATRELNHLAQLETLLSMETQLKRGFALVQQNNRLLTQAQQLQPEQEVVIQWQDGTRKGKFVAEG